MTRSILQHLTGRVGVVTGAANGIGRELAERCGALGMHVVIADVEADELAQVAAGIRERAPNATVVCVTVDASTVEGVAQLLEATVGAFGPAPNIALLFNNVGVQGAGIDVLGSSSLEDWDYMFSVNVLSILRSTRAFLPLMLAQQLPSHIVNTASMAGLAPAAQSYGVTKRAAVALSEAIDHDLRAKTQLVRCSVLTPAFVHTNFHRVQRIETLLRGSEARQLPPIFDTNTKKMLHSPGSIPVQECVDAVFAAMEKDLFYIVPPGSHQAFAKKAVHHLMNSQLKGKSPYMPRGLEARLTNHKTTGSKKEPNSKL